MSKEPVEKTEATCESAWFCIRTQPKHEHIAAAHLRNEAGIEVYLPRIRFKRSTRRGPKWFTDALFPNYLFARFDLPSCVRRVHHTRGVRGVVHFGDEWPAVPANAIEELRATVGSDHIHVISEELRPGDAVQISGGVFHGLTAEHAAGNLYCIPGTQLFRNNMDVVRSHRRPKFLNSIRGNGGPFIAKVNHSPNPVSMMHPSNT